MNRRTKLAWAAGLFDGEGCICIYQSGKAFGQSKTARFHLSVAIAMSSKKTVEKFQKIVRVGTVGPKNVGNKPKHYKPIHQWIVTAKQAEFVLNQIYPYMVTKKPEAKIAFKYLKIPKASTHPKPNSNNIRIYKRREKLLLLLREAKREIV